MSHPRSRMFLPSLSVVRNELAIRSRVGAPRSQLPAQMRRFNFYRETEEREKRVSLASNSSKKASRESKSSWNFLEIRHHSGRSMPDLSDFTRRVLKLERGEIKAFEMTRLSRGACVRDFVVPVPLSFPREFREVKGNWPRCAREKEKERGEPG